MKNLALLTDCTGALLKGSD